MYICISQVQGHSIRH